MLGRSRQSEPGAKGMCLIRAATRALMSCRQRARCHRGGTRGDMGHPESPRHPAREGWGRGTRPSSSITFGRAWGPSLSPHFTSNLPSTPISAWFSVWGGPSAPRHPHLADMVPEDGLILGAPDLPLEPRLGLPVVGDLQGGGTVPDLRQVGHGVAHRDGAKGAGIRPGRNTGSRERPNCHPARPRRGSEGSPRDVADELLVVHHDAQLAGARRKDVQRLGEHGQLLAGRRGEDDGSAARLGNAVLASLGGRDNSRCHRSFPDQFVSSKSSERPPKTNQTKPN